MTTVTNRKGYKFKKCSLWSVVSNYNGISIANESVKKKTWASEFSAV